MPYPNYAELRQRMEELGLAPQGRAAPGYAPPVGTDGAAAYAAPNQILPMGMPPAPPPNQGGFWSQAGETAAKGLGGLGQVLGGAMNVVDLPFSTVRDVANNIGAAFTGGQMVNPLDQWAAPWWQDAGRRTGGRDMLRNWGAIGEENTIPNFLAGLALEAVLSGGLAGLGKKALATTAAGALKPTVLGSLLRPVAAPVAAAMEASPAWAKTAARVAVNPVGEALGYGVNKVRGFPQFIHNVRARNVDWERVRPEIVAELMPEGMSAAEQNLRKSIVDEWMSGKPAPPIPPSAAAAGVSPTPVPAAATPASSPAAVASMLEPAAPQTFGAGVQLPEQIAKQYGQGPVNLFGQAAEPPVNVGGQLAALPEQVTNPRALPTLVQQGTPDITFQTGPAPPITAKPVKAKAKTKAVKPAPAPAPVEPAPLAPTAPAAPLKAAKVGKTKPVPWVADDPGTGNVHGMVRDYVKENPAAKYLLKFSPEEAQRHQNMLISFLHNATKDKTVMTALEKGSVAKATMRATKIRKFLNDIEQRYANVLAPTEQLISLDRLASQVVAAEAK